MLKAEPDSPFTPAQTAPDDIITPVARNEPNPSVHEQDLIEMCNRHIANRQKLEDCPLDPDDSPHWPPYAATSGAISAARPMSMAGLAAKARAARCEALTQSGRYDPRNGAALEWAWDLVQDLIRLDAAAA